MAKIKCPCCKKTIEVIASHDGMRIIHIECVEEEKKE